MTIKISQLANLTVTQANTIVPVVSNITGTLTTVQANIQQLQDYIITNGVSANITALYANAATQSDLIIGINSNVTQANLGMKGYVDNQTYSNVQVSTYLPTYSGNIAALTVTNSTSLFGNIFFANNYVPTLANSTGSAGQISYDSSYIYICLSTNTWKRANISTW